jgi:hypothetical protein
MSTKRYDWKRYWIPKDKELPLDGDGFLLDPEESPIFRWSQTNDAVGFDSLIKAPCLVLLGEPGMGKSDTVKMAEVLTREAVEGAGGQVLLRNLGAYNTDAGLVESVFRSDQFMDWRSGRCQLHLFLDSLDECRISIQGVAKLLSEKLRDLPNTNNLFLRITCRIGDWPESLETALIEKWGDGVPRILILAPLTHSQVAQAARHEGQDADAFVEAVIARELVPFARSPLTLRFLLSSWAKSERQLPKSLREIYEAGCRRLCEDLPERVQDKHRPTLSPEERTAVASLIAAGLIFGGLQEVWANPSEVERPTGTLSIADLTDRQVTTRKVVTAITEPALRLVLDSGLFTSRGANLYTWTHKTYAEFLAARWLEREGLKPKQILDLLTSPVDGEGKLVPQLHQTAAWAAKPETDLFRHLLEIQPEILLGSDLSVVDDSTKERLLKAVLDAIEEDRLSEGVWTLYKRWRKLSYPGMARALRERLTDTRLDSYTRETVIQIVTSEACRELLPDLLRISLDDDEKARVRQFAAQAVVDLGDANDLRALRPLALGLAGPDPKQALRGICLEACWPKYLTAEELFQSLDGATLDSDFRCRSFLNGDWPKALGPQELVQGLTWIGQLENEEIHGHGTFSGLVHRILDASTPHLHHDDVLRALVGAIVGRRSRHDDLRSDQDSRIATRIKEDAKLRHRMTEIALSIMPDPIGNAFLLTFGGLRLVGSEDLLWLVGEMVKSVDPAVRPVWGDLVQRTLESWNPLHVDTLLSARQNDPSIEDLCPLLLKPIEWRSEEAMRLRRNHELNRWDPIVRVEHSGPIIPTSVAIDHALHEFEGGDLTRWVGVCKMLATDDKGRLENFGATWDLRRLQGWGSLSSDDIARLECAADAYIRAKEVLVGPWFFGKGGYPYELIVGLQALLLLQDTPSRRTAALPTDVWARWVPAILRIPEYGSGEGQERLVKAAFQNAPDAAEEWMVKAIEAAIAEQSGFAILGWMPAPIRPSFSLSLLRLIQSEATAPPCMAGMVELLWQHSLSGVAGWVEEFLRSSDATTPRHADRTRLLCQVLVAKAEAQHWPWIWGVFERSIPIGRTIFMTMAERSYPDRLPRILVGVAEADIAQLWEWAVREFPPAKYPRMHGGGIVSDTEFVAGFRDYLLIHLRDSGTSKACHQLSRLGRTFPEFTQIRQLERQAFANRRKNEWQPIDPERLFQMARNPRTRWVESEAQLLEVIVDSLEQFEARLQGPDPLAELLWNDDYPKTERVVSTWVASELRRDLSADGILLNREVVIRSEDRLDILVEANCRDAKSDQFRQIRVIIEVKRDFNPGVDHAMETQLDDRYLSDNNCQTGLYLVAWFNRNRQRGEKAQERLKDFRAKLEAQAKRESCAGKILRAWVLDCSLLRPGKLARPKSRAKPAAPSKSAQGRRTQRKPRED